ncbi:MAG: glycosyltransferase family 2 protein [Bacteroidales bacterium]|nr:glycosyltransferase family 2 protein [Bacteroidales bacterium]
MAQHPHISIILPVYNGEQYLSESIESVLSQTYDDFEFIIVNDGSTDHTQQIISAYSQRDQRVKIILQENSGVSAARNAGIDSAKGEYLTFIDADDTIARDFLSHCVEYCSGSDIVSADFTHVKSDLGAKLARSKHLGSIEYLKEVLYQKSSSPAVWGKLFHKRLFAEVRFWPYRYEDLEIFPKLVLQANGILQLGEALYFYRNHPNSFINTVSISRFDTLKANESILNVCRETGDAELIEAALCRRLSASFNAFCISINRPEFSDFHSQAWTNIKKCRKRVFFNRHSPLKIKIGILVSAFGQGALSRINQLLKISS